MKSKLKKKAQWVFPTRSSITLMQKTMSACTSPGYSPYIGCSSPGYSETSGCSTGSDPVYGSCNTGTSMTTSSANCNSPGSSATYCWPGH